MIEVAICPTCGQPGTVRETLLGGIRRATCRADGPFFARAPKARARAGDPETSYEAAQSVAVTNGQRAVLAAFAAHGDMTDDALVGRVQLSPSGARSRRAELVDVGLIVDTGRRATSGTGRKMTVWGRRP